MSDQPKVSERMRDLVITLETNAANYECHGGHYALVELGESRNALLSAIAEIEQRAERAEGMAAACEAAVIAHAHITKDVNDQRIKWREVTLAFYALAEAIDSPTAHKDDVFSGPKARVDAAIAALGDEWDEAVKGEG